MIWFIIIGVVLIISIVIAIKEKDGSLVGFLGIPLCGLVLASGAMVSALISSTQPTTQLASTETKILYKLNEEASTDEIIYLKIDSEKNQGWCLVEDDNAIGKDYLSIDMEKAKIFETSKDEAPCLIEEKYNGVITLFSFIPSETEYKYNLYIPKNTIRYQYENGGI